MSDYTISFAGKIVAGIGVAVGVGFGATPFADGPLAPAESSEILEARWDERDRVWREHDR